MNAQLKKKHGKQCINDLVHDMQDGTAFADLIEVIGQYAGNDAFVCPSIFLRSASIFVLVFLKVVNFRRLIFG